MQSINFITSVKIVNQKCHITTEAKGQLVTHDFIKKLKYKLMHIMKNLICVQRILILKMLMKIKLH